MLSVGFAHVTFPGTEAKALCNVVEYLEYSFDHGLLELRSQKICCISVVVEDKERSYTPQQMFTWIIQLIGALLYLDRFELSLRADLRPKKSVPHHITCILKSYRLRFNSSLEFLKITHLDWVPFGDPPPRVPSDQMLWRAPEVFQ